jgi:PQQ-dependent dehydrogenase (s-GDH family)
MQRLGAFAIVGVVVLGASVLLAQNPRTNHHHGAESFTGRTLTANLDNPWDLAWGPDDHLWVTERTAFKVTRINPRDGTRRVALVISDGYHSVVQDGLLGLALHPDLLEGRGADFVFVAYTYDRDKGPGLDRRLRVRRYTYRRESQTLDSPVDVIDGLSAHDDHGGGRMTIGPDGKLYLSRGDNGSNWLANYCNRIRSQDLPTAGEVRARDWTNYQGKMLRLELDGSVPADNPVFRGVRSHIYATGLRNVQGMVFGPGGQLFASDHGPGTDDELNVIEAGRNYGWPHVAGFNDDRAYVYANWSAAQPAPCHTLTFDRVGAPPTVPRTKESAWHEPSFAPPVATFFTVEPDYDIARLGAATIAPAGIDVYASRAIPGWDTSILITGMRTGAIYRVKLDASGRAKEGEVTEYFRSADRYRDVVVSPDGRRIYVSTDNFGTTLAPDDRSTSRLAHPGSIIEFTYTTPAPRH